ncbi:hypothetical protein Tco_0442583, partial [Tanacetum coccineum]
IDQTDDANITFIGSSIDINFNDSGSDPHSLLSDDLTSLIGFVTPDSNDEEFNSVTKKHSADNLNATSDGDDALPNASSLKKANAEEQKWEKNNTETPKDNIEYKVVSWVETVVTCQESYGGVTPPNWVAAEYGSGGGTS